jgi:hypothetical protein
MRWRNGELIIRGPYLTLAEVIAIEKAEQQSEKGDEEISSD